MPMRNSEDARMVQELLERAAELSTYGVMSKTDMARIRALCEAPSTYPPW
jgi:putative transcriptional regulator